MLKKLGFLKAGLTELLSIGLVSCLLGANVHADETGFYAGFDVGSFEFEEQDASSSKTSFGIHGGYSFNQYIDVEASFFDAGDHDELGLKATGFSLSVIGKYSINNRWQLFGELGGLSLDQSIDEANTTMNSDGEDTLSDGRDSSLFLGYGVKYKTTQWVFTLKNAYADTDADFTALTLGASYKF